MNMDQLKSKLDGAEGASSGGIEYEDRPRVNITPEVAIRGEIVSISLAGSTSDQNNIRAANGQGTDFVLSIRNPEVVNGTIFEATGRTDADDNLIRNVDYSEWPNVLEGPPSSDFRVVPENWESASHMGEYVEKVGDDYEQVGIEQYGNSFAATEVDGFDSALEQYDIIDVFVGKRPGRIIAASLDISQGLSAYPSDGGIQEGLIEFPQAYGTNAYDPTVDGYPRATTQPLLHSEVAGEEITMLYHFGDMDDDWDDADEEDDEGGQYRTHFGDILLHTERDGEQVDLKLSDLSGPVLDPELDRRDEDNVILRYHDEDTGGTSSSNGASTSSSGSSFDFDELDDSQPATDSDDTNVTFSDLDPDTATFVRGAVEYVEGTGMGVDAFDDFESVVETAKEDGDIPGDYGAGTLAGIVNSEAGDS